MMNHYLREIINCMNYNTVLSQVFFFLLLGFHAHVREVSKVSHLYFYPGFSFIFMAINLLEAMVYLAYFLDYSVEHINAMSFC